MQIKVTRRYSHTPMSTADKAGVIEMWCELSGTVASTNWWHHIGKQTLYTIPEDKHTRDATIILLGIHLAKTCVYIYAPRSKYKKVPNSIICNNNPTWEPTQISINHHQWWGHTREMNKIQWHALMWVYFTSVQLNEWTRYKITPSIWFHSIKSPNTWGNSWFWKWKLASWKYKEQESDCWQSQHSGYSGGRLWVTDGKGQCGNSDVLPVFSPGWWCPLSVNLPNWTFVLCVFHHECHKQNKKRYRSNDN